MEFETFTVVTLVLRDDAPEHSEQEAAELQDAHLAFLAEMHERESLLAAGPTVDPDAPQIRGFEIWGTDPAAARELASKDPAVQVGRLELELSGWIVPAGAVSFDREAKFPRSVAEATGS
jgi:hypothetical protein